MSKNALCLHGGKLTLDCIVEGDKYIWKWKFMIKYVL